MTVPARTRSAAERLGPIAILAVLFGCHATRAPVAPSMHERAAHALPSPRGPSRYLAASWSFTVTARACVARAQHPGLSFSVIIGQARSIELVMEASASHGSASRGAAPGELGFTGDSGAWRVPARSRGRTVEASLPPTERGLDDVLALLGGGRLFARTIDASLPGLNVPDAGVAGRDWFGCTRTRLITPVGGLHVR